MRFNIRLDIVRHLGDDWEHEITVEKILPADPERAYPTCVDGKQHGQPEDCGGVPGFYNLLDAIGDPTHDQHEELLGGVGDDFDPEAFSIDEVNRRLAPSNRRRSKAESA